MGLFDSVGKVFKDVGKFVEDEVIEPVAKDAIPAAAAYFTGGKSLAVLPPSESGLANKVTDGMAGDIIGGVMSGGAQQTPSAPQVKPAPRRPVVDRSQLSTAGINPAAQPPLRPEAQSTSFLQDMMQILQAPQNKSDVANSPQVGNNSEQVQNSNQGMETGTMILIGLSAASLVAMIVFARGK